MKEKSYKSKSVLHSKQKKKTLIFTHEKKGQSGPVFGLILLCVLDAWERGRFFVSWWLGTWGSHPLSRHLETRNCLKTGALLLEAQKKLMQ
jgi:hypothetical protein